jgi:hypothetical protein
MAVGLATAADVTANVGVGVGLGVGVGVAFGPGRPCNARFVLERCLFFRVFARLGLPENISRTKTSSKQDAGTSRMRISLRFRCMGRLLCQTMSWKNKDGSAAVLEYEMKKSRHSTIQARKAYSYKA